MKALLGTTLTVMVFLPFLASAQGLSASMKDRNSTTMIGAMPAEPGTLPLRSGRSAYKSGSAGDSSGASRANASPRICTNCDD